MFEQAKREPNRKRNHHKHKSPVGDFGISTVLKNNEKCKGVVGSVIFMSPEIFNQ